MNFEKSSYKIKIYIKEIHEIDVILNGFLEI